MSLMVSANNREVDNDLMLQTEAYNRSDRYKVVQTQKVVDLIKEIEPSAEIVGFNKSRTRITEKVSKQKHVVMLEMDDNVLLDGLTSNIILYNSYDGSSSMKIFYGQVRWVCDNMCVAGDLFEEPVTLRHTKNMDWKYSIYDFMNKYKEKQEKLTELYYRMQGKYTSYSDMMRYAEVVASEVINPNITGEVFDIGDIVRVEREEDKGKNAYIQFQKAQEHTIRGGVRRVITQEDKTKKMSNTHIVTDQKKLIDMNRKLFDVTVDFFNLAA